ncbi:hypothetical protein SAMN05444858_11485 [Micromonospora avicenniae]|uniref:Uncharacterized protein n=1 Tax=Micromonospora avicenniae TaxID=1198245 RepID=A0A1N7CX55_9ACTN|nr:hypothetical protein SAMN05444858_11485 [Micromonospora avicenniae]
MHFRPRWNGFGAGAICGVPGRQRAVVGAHLLTRCNRFRCGANR